MVISFSKVLLSLLWSYFCLLSARGSLHRRLDDKRPGNSTRILQRETLVKSMNLQLFLSITSSPMHASLRHASRSTWLLPCMTSPVCDYKFFIDQSEQVIDEALKQEYKQYSDMVFRDACDLMNRHPSYINYGNSPPTKEHINQKISDMPEVLAGDYFYRRMYKIDWKVCFMRYARDHGKMAEFHAFVEDDSFACTQNLLAQTALLHAKSLETGKRHSFRTGTAMFDGFDDSSTLMTRDVALAFADHYEQELNCSHVLDNPNSTIWEEAVWQSWGNSWMRKRCDWMHQLRTQLHMHVLKPSMDCMTATAVNVSKQLTTLAFPCADRAIIMHHGVAGSVLLQYNASHVRHTCEYMLLIDKVKDPDMMHTLWDAFSEHTYHDFSEVFLHEGDAGWLQTLEGLAAENVECHKQHPAVAANGTTNCLFEHRRRGLRGSGIVPESLVSVHESLSDIFYSKLLSSLIL